MRYYVWYSPEINVIVLQTIAQDHEISFEWDHYDMHENLEYPDIGIDSYLWIPIGEL